MSETSADRAAALESVRGSVLRYSPNWRRAEDVREELPLGFGGLELDSVSVVQMLCDLEKSTGVRIPARLMGDGLLTVGKLVDHLSHNRPESGRAGRPG
jgi:acyl carrier protein